MKHFCTLFDKNYLIKGLILQKSLHRHMGEPYMLHILAMDIETENALMDQDAIYPVNVIPLHKVEIAIGLDSVRQSRTWQEYCWTMASQLMQFLLPISRGGTLTYLDADMMFFSDPQPIFEEMGPKSIAIIPHRFTPQNRTRLEKNGKFNVSWVTIRGNAIGWACINHWARQCREKCSAHDGCGDQKYLNDWPLLYSGEVCEIQNIGAGLAPWNLPNYLLGELDGKVIVGGDDLIFYHYHELQHKAGTHDFHLTNYPLRPEDRELIYKPYLKEWYELTLESISA